MIRGFILFCVFLILGAGIYQVIEKGDSGYLLIVWGKVSIETSLWFACLALLVVLFLWWFCGALFRGSFRGLMIAKQKMFDLADDKAQKNTTDGLIDFIEGDWSSARRRLTRSASKAQAPIINYLTAACSAYEMGEEQKALELLHKAESSTERGGLAVAITQARMQLSNKQYEQALATLERASSIRSEHPVVLSLLQQVYVELKDWNSLEALLPRLARYNICSETERQHLEQMLNQERLNEAIKRHKSSSDTEKKSALNDVWFNIPSHFYQDKTILSTYASQLMALGEHDEAEKILSSGLNKHWYGQWVDLYGFLIPSDEKKLLKNAEKWLSKQPKSANLLLTLGRLCILNNQWGRSVDFFEQSLAIQKRPETYAELARVLDYIGETEKSVNCYKQGLMAATTVLMNDQPLAIKY